MTSTPVLVGIGDLQQQLGSADCPLLVDVRLEDDHAAGHLPGAASNCVYEVAFLERMEKLAPDREAPLCVYGTCADSMESRTAAEKLRKAGWRNVREFRDGWEAWTEAGHAPQAAAEPSTPPVRDGAHAIDLRESSVNWTGRNLLNKHEGTIALKSGTLETAGGTLTGGRFVLDMHDVACADLKGDSLHGVLIAHLLSDDFFDVENYPEAVFEITSAEPVAGADAGAPNLKITGLLTLKDATHPVEFTASSGVTDEGKLAAQASFAIDRTRWGVIYGSGKFFRRLGGHLVNDMIDLQLRIVTG